MRHPFIPAGPAALSQPRRRSDGRFLLSPLRWRGVLAVAVLVLLGPLPALATAQAQVPGLVPRLSLTPSVPSGQLVGSTVTWTVTRTDRTEASSLVSQFSVATPDGPFQVVRDFSVHNTFAWMPLQEGLYSVRAIVKAGFGDAEPIAALTASFMVLSRVRSGAAVVTALPNPLVALYSAPPCAAGYLRVQFRAVATATAAWTSTSAHPCQPGTSVNVVVAGLEAQTSYQMRHVVSSATGIMTATAQTFTTGMWPASVRFPPLSVPLAPLPQSDTTANVLVHALALTGPGVPNPLATDLAGRPVWYYDPQQAGLSGILPTSLTPEGTMLLLGSDGLGQTSPLTQSANVLREIDLAGTTIRETNVDQVNAQLATRGDARIYTFHHEALRLPNGDTAVLGQTMRRLNGQAIMGDMVLVLDRDFQVVWSWDAFDHARQITHGPTIGPLLGETCAVANPGALCAVPDPKALDWLHTNAIGWSPADGNLTLSLRHQDWVIKIDYRGGLGDGHVLWRLGKDGDFALHPINATDPSPWFSHQHNAHFIDPTTLVLFDNGNTRCTDTTGTTSSGCDSRGQVLTLDEQSRVVTQTVNIDVGNYSFALGSAQRLANGNYVFTSGFQRPPAGPPFAQSIEVRPDGTKVYVQQVTTAEYRTLRVPSLYGVQSLAPSITLSPLTARPGDRVTVRGAGFAAGEQITVALNGTALSTTVPLSTTADGVFTATARVPDTLVEGPNTVSAIGTLSRIAAVAALAGRLPLAAHVYFAGGRETATEHSFVDLLNPTDQPTRAQLLFYGATGASAPLSRTLDLAPRSEQILPVAAVHLAAGTFGLAVTATRRIAAQLTITRAGQDGDVLLATPGLSTTWYLAEGYTGGTFRETVAVLNPDPAAPAHIQLHLLPLGGHGGRTVRLTVPPQSERVTDVTSWLARRSLSIIATADRPVAVERTLTFSSHGYGLTTRAGITAPATSWLFAEGTTVPPFETYLTILNPTSRPARVRARFYGPSGGLRQSTTLSVGAGSRANIKLNTVLSASGISTLITSDQPVVVERAEYFGSPNARAVAGSDVFGLNGAGLHWSFPGGATAGDDEFLLLYNPTSLPLTIEVTFYGSAGQTVSRWVHVPPVARATLDVQALAPGFPLTHGVILQSASGQGFIAEQTVFTPDHSALRSTEGLAQ